jgi:hypothetical protein
MAVMREEWVVWMEVILVRLVMVGFLGESKSSKDACIYSSELVGTRSVVGERSIA